jgi:hypothetical protein
MTKTMSVRHFTKQSMGTLKEFTQSRGGQKNEAKTPKG